MLDLLEGLVAILSGERELRARHAVFAAVVVGLGLILVGAGLWGR